MNTRTKNFELGGIYWTKSKTPEQFKIVEIKSARLENGGILIEFLDGGYRGWYDARTLSRGNLVSPYSKTVFGIGYVGEGDFKPTSFDNSPTRVYNRWKAMLQRCYDSKNSNNSSYEFCEVSEEWKNFQTFAKWIVQQAGWDEDWHLDKDLIKAHNGLYSEDTCCLIPVEINSALAAKSKHTTNGLPCGVFYHKKNDCYVVRIGKQYYGSFSTVDAAKEVAKVSKEDMIKRLAEKYKDKLPIRTYVALMNYKYSPVFVEKKTY